MGTKTVLVLLLGTAVMMIIILCLMSRYKVKYWKAVPVSVLLTFVGTLSTYIWYFVESSRFGARSFYGAVFLVPLCFWLIAKWMRISYGDLMDFCAPAECAMLVLMKYQCFVDGCCGGKVLGVADDGQLILFPSQLVETANAFILMIVLIWIAYKRKWRGKVYAWYLVLYGITRFILNWYREDISPLLIGLPDGNLWSLIAVFIGFMWLFGYKLAIVKKADQTERTDEDINFA